MFSSLPAVLRRFARDASGAVTLDWLTVMSAATIATVLGVYTMLEGVGDDDGLAGFAVKSEERLGWSASSIDNLVNTAEISPLVETGE